MSRKSLLERYDKLRGSDHPSTMVSREKVAEKMEDAGDMMDINAFLEPPANCVWLVLAYLYVPKDKIDEKTGIRGMVMPIKSFYDRTAAETYATQLVEEGRFNSTRVEMVGRWNPLVPDDKARNVILTDGTGARFMMEMKNTAKNSNRAKFESARDRMLYRTDIEQRMEFDNPDDIVSYMYVMTRLEYLLGHKDELARQIRETDTIIDKYVSMKKQRDELHPEFIDQWKDKLNEYSDKSGTTNPFGDSVQDRTQHQIALEQCIRNLYNA